MDAFKQRLASFGTSEAMAQAYIDMMTAKNEGMDNTEPHNPREHDADQLPAMGRRSAKALDSQLAEKLLRKPNPTMCKEKEVIQMMRSGNS